MKTPILAVLCALTASQANADLTARFLEGAPKDRFVLTNTGGCALPALRITVDLSTAPAGLVFDVTESGAGVQVFQPFDMVAGAELLTGMPTVLDGDAAVTLDLTSLAPAQEIAFTIDVDDTGGGREITVSNAEIVGASVTVTIDATRTTGVFDNTSQAVVGLEPCLA